MKTVKKIMSNKGESLLESLVAILVSALAIAFLVTSIVTSTRITEKSRKAMDEYYEANDTVIMQTSGGTAGTVTLKDGGAGIKITPDQSSEKISVKFYTNDRLRDTEVTSYRAD